MKSYQSKFFEFKSKLLTNGIYLSEFRGWNGLIIIRLDLEKSSNIRSNLINSEHFDLYNKEKIIVTTKGDVEFKLRQNNYLLKEFDALNLYSKDSNFEIKSLTDSQVFIVSALDLEPQEEKYSFFNFIKDIKPNDIWGGQCISRVFQGKDLNLVLFDLKADFEFHDKGHQNEQVTWVVKGNMDFYVSKTKKKLYSGLGVDIASFDIHGGISNGAIGFDAFYPKRHEEKYK